MLSLSKHVPRMTRSGLAGLMRQDARLFAWSPQYLSTIPEWATVDPNKLSGSNVFKAQNLVNGEWRTSSKTRFIIDPLNGEDFIEVPDTQISELGPFIDSMRSVPKSGLHNPLKNPERYTMLGNVCEKAAHELGKPEVAQFFSRLIQRVVCKHETQCMGEIVTCKRWLSSFSGDQVRNLSRSFGLAGDHPGQETRGYRWPFGATAVITPFNFPVEIPLLQALSSLFMGNKVVVKSDWKVQIVFEQVLRMLHHAGLPKTDMDLLYSDGAPMGELVLKGDARMTLFTGSQAVAEKLAVDLKGRLKLEDAGFDWKVLGPDPSDVDYVAWQCDQDAYAFSGQKCSAQSIMFMHKNWTDLGIVEKLAACAGARNVEDLSIGPVLSWTNKAIEDHIIRLLEIPGAYVAFGGQRLKNHSIPECYGSMEPTAIFVPIKEILSDEHWSEVTKEIFGPFQVISEYTDEELPMVLEALEKMDNHLTAAVVSNDSTFCSEVLGRTVNGTTYTGIRARTTGAPANHWFGPASDPRAAGIHTPEAIKLVWSGHRELIIDQAPVSSDWVMPKPT